MTITSRSTARPRLPFPTIRLPVFRPAAGPPSGSTGMITPPSRPRLRARRRARGRALRRAWEERLAALAPPRRAEFLRRQQGGLPSALSAAIGDLVRGFQADKAQLATRQASGICLDTLCRVVPELVGGSADLTGSNNTKARDQKAVRPGDFAGRYIHYGVREHAMAAAMNGIAAHGGLIPYGGTFLAFSDYCRPAIRLAALMELGVIYVLTHDSIGLGEDGPTHQPVEHLAALRAIPHVHLFRPADAVETAECWELALKRRRGGPSVLCLTRQPLPLLRTAAPSDNRSARGAYVLAEAAGARRVTLLATGSEVAIALAARDLLARDGVAAAVVSMPCWELFAQQPAEYRAAVLGSTPRVGVEAAIGAGWERWLGPRSAFVGMSGFGASAPAEALYRHFGITPQAVAAAARSLL